MRAKNKKWIRENVQFANSDLSYLKTSNSIYYIKGLFYYIDNWLLLLSKQASQADGAVILSGYPNYIV